MNIKPSQQLVKEAQNSIETLNSKDVKKLAENNEITLIDVRDIRELWKEGTIENSKHIPRGMLEFWVDPESPYYKTELNNTEEVILFCNKGWRSALAAASLKSMGIENISHMSGGFDQWEKEIGRVAVIQSK